LKTPELVNIENQNKKVAVKLLEIFLKNTLFCGLMDLQTFKLRLPNSYLEKRDPINIILLKLNLQRWGE
jgi:hypothetical protein